MGGVPRSRHRKFRPKALFLPTRRDCSALKSRIRAKLSARTQMQSLQSGPLLRNMADMVDGIVETNQTRRWRKGARVVADGRRTSASDREKRRGTLKSSTSFSLLEGLRIVWGTKPCGRSGTFRSPARIRASAQAFRHRGTEAATVNSSEAMTEVQLLQLLHRDRRIFFGRKTPARISWFPSPLDWAIVETWQKARHPIARRAQGN